VPVQSAAAQSRIGRQNNMRMAVILGCDGQQRGQPGGMRRARAARRRKYPRARWFDGATM
jgi:hypothetical protein